MAMVMRRDIRLWLEPLAFLMLGYPATFEEHDLLRELQIPAQPPTPGQPD